MKWFWGILFILIGLLALSLNFGWLRPIQISEIVKFWPVILILLGLAIFARNWRWGWILVLAGFVISFGLIYYAAIKNVPIKKEAVRRNQNVSTANFSEKLPSNIKKAKISIKTGAINLNLKSGKDLISGQLVSSFASPKISVKTENDVANITFETVNEGRIFWGGENKLDMQITDSIPVELTIDAGATKMELDLTKVKLSNLNINTGASEIDAKISQFENNGKIFVNAGASDISFEIPKNLGVQISTKTGLSEKQFKDFTQTENNTYKNAAFDSAQTKIFIEFKTGVSSIKVDQK